MKRAARLAISVFICFSGTVSADIFGTGGNQFTIEFVTIAGDTGTLGKWSAGDGYTFSGVNHGDYRMGKFEITNDQWDKFRNEYGAVTGSPSSAYENDAYYTGPNFATENVSWYEAAQFVNWLNTSNGYHPAYRFTGTQGTANYTFAVWNLSESWNLTNRYRHKDSFYFLPSEDEWVKAAYWNGKNLQTYATLDGSVPIAGVDTNYGQDSPPYENWDVGSGSEELHGTYDMMGNRWEWMESPFYTGNYAAISVRAFRGGSLGNTADLLSSSYRTVHYPYGEDFSLGFRVASVIPEPATVFLFALGAMLAGRRNRT